MFTKFMFKAPLSSLRENFLKSSYLRLIQNIFFPPECILCGLNSLAFAGTHRASLCHDCHKDLPILPQKCIRCAQFINTGETILELTCGQCLRFPPSFERTHTLFPYQDPISFLLIQLKFHHKLYIAKTLGELMVEKIKNEWYPTRELPDLIIPIPLHRDRLRERGFNQALEIARPIAKAFHLPLDVTGVKRIKKTAAQSGLRSQARKENVANAFTTQRDYSSLFIAVLDDVVTTGHTIREFSKILKENGAKRVDIWCGARNG